MWAEGRWVRAWAYMHRDPGALTGIKNVWEAPFEPSGGPSYNSGQMLRREFSGNICAGTAPSECPTASSGWDRVGFNGYVRAMAANSHQVFDDAYVATGPGAQARVEVANHQTWGDTTAANARTMNIALCVPSSWTATSVTCQFHSGPLATGEAAYLFVIDAAGNVSDQDPSTPGSQGYPVTIGSSGGGEPGDPPPAVQNLSRTDTQ
jgi:hypothetical protein